MKKELKIKIDVFHKTVIFAVLEMDDSERGKGVLIRLEDNKIIKVLRSIYCVEMDRNNIYIQGKNRECDENCAIRKYATEEEAQQAYEDILRLVEEYNKQLNKPKFEESKEYKQQIEMNKLIMDMRKWQFENDVPVDMTKEEEIYYIEYNIFNKVAFVNKYRLYRPIGAVFFSSKEKARECAIVFDQRFKEIYEE